MSTAEEDGTGGLAVNGVKMKDLPTAEGEGAAKEDVNFEDILERYCGTGRWQILIVAYMSVMWLIFPTFSMSMMFIGATPEFKCADGFDENATFASLPSDTPRCHRPNSTAACSRWAFDRSVYESTVVTEWNLVCDRKPLLSMLQSWLMLGGLVGSFISGELADRFGRRPVFLPFMLMVIACAFAAAFATSYSVFASVRFLTGFAMAAMINCQYVLMTELCGPRQRAIFGTLSFLPFAFGTSLVAAASYGIRTRWLLQLALAVPYLVLLPNYWLMPESPRWLVLNGKLSEAYEVLKRGARWNGRQLPPEDDVLRVMSQAREDLLAREAVFKGASKEGPLERVLQLVRTPRMCRYTLALAFMFFVISGSYFGISFDTAQLSSSPHLAAALSGLADIPPSLSFVLLDRFGRRPSQALFLFLTAAVMLLVFAKKDPTFWLVLGLIGKVAVSSAFSAVVLFSAEIMPTRVRVVAAGVQQMATRLGAAVSPFVVDLVSELHESAPAAVFGVCALLAGLATLLLPETLGKPMPETVADVEGRLVGAGSDEDSSNASCETGKKQ